MHTTKQGEVPWAYGADEGLGTYHKGGKAIMYEIKWVGSPNYRPGRNGRKIIAIVDHITAGLMPGALSWMQNPLAKASAHYLVTRKGDIYQLVRDEDTAYHAGVVNKPDWVLYDGSNPNYYTIGIEHEGYKNQGGDGFLTENQYQATLWLHKRLITKWNLGTAYDYIIGHYRIDSVNRPFCPGVNFPFTRIFADLQKEGTNMGLEKWMVEGGQKALAELTRQKLLNNPQMWANEKKLAEPVPLYLLWMMLQRVVEKLQSK